MVKTAEIVPYDTSPAMLARITSIDEVKKYVGALKGMEEFQKANGATRDEVNTWLERRIRVLRRGGQILAGMKRAQGTLRRGHKMLPRANDARYSDLGVTKMQASRWQTLARIPERQFEEFCKKTRTGEDRLTLAAAINLAKPGNVPDSVASDVEGCTVEDLHTLVAAGYKFGTIYADPPWAYGNQATRASTGNHYKTKSVKWLCEPENMPVEALAADTAHLHLWTTNAFLFEAKKVMEAWGFTAKSCFVWVKTQMGIGNYWRVSHEFLLLGVRGKLRFRDKGLKSWAECKRGKHSDKPDQVRALVEKASPTPRLELFGRRAVPGWVVWGDQVARDLLTVDAPAL